jgi:hypothetical protein
LKQKRITSVFTTTTAEGSRVTVASDSPLNDYEAYRRGDRFYLRIPLADLPSARGSLLGRGFDDVQIQRYGDGVIFSFRLQPGTTAHVAEAPNRLDVIFSTPGRSQNVIAPSADRGAVADRTRARRIGDTSGPAPPSSTGVSAPVHGVGGRNSPVVSGSSRAARYRRGNGSKRASTARSSSYSTRDGRNPTASTSHTPSLSEKAVGSSSETAPSPGPKPSSTTQPGPSSAASPARSSSFPSPSPVAAVSPSPSASSVASGSSASPFSTLASSPAPSGRQATSVATQTPATASPVGASTDWSSRIRYYKLWAKLNWLPLLIGGLVVLCLLVLLLSWRRAKRKGVVKVTPVKQEATRQTAPTAPASEAQSKSSLISSPAKDREPAGIDQEREVFEL